MTAVKRIGPGSWFVDEFFSFYPLYRSYFGSCHTSRYLDGWVLR